MILLCLQLYLALEMFLILIHCSPLPSILESSWTTGTSGPLIENMRNMCSYFVLMIVLFCNADAETSHVVGLQFEQTGLEALGSEPLVVDECHVGTSTS